MKKIKFLSKLIIQILFFISIFNVIYAKNYEKYYQEDKISNYFSGILLLNDNDYINSYKKLKQLDGLESIHLPYSRLYQYSLVNLERIDEAYKFSKNLEKEKIDSFESNLIIGVYYLKNKKYEKAKKYFKKMEKFNQSQYVQELLTRSLNIWISFIEQDQENALQLINSIPKKFENIKQIQLAFAHCFYESKNTNQEFKNLISKSNIDLSRYNFFQADYLYKNNKINEANELLELTLKNFPQNLILRQLKEDFNNKIDRNFANQFDCKDLSHNIAELFYIISNIFSSRSFYSSSNFYLNLANYLNPKFASFKSLYAENFYMIGNLNEAKNIYDEIQNKGEEYNWFSSKQIAKIYKKQKKKELSLKFLDSAFKNIKSPNVYKLYDYAEFLRNSEKYKKSILHYTKALQLIDSKHSLYPKITYSRGVAYERIEKWSKSEEDLLNSLEAKPNQAYVMNYLAYTWIEKGKNIDKSLEMLKTANELKKDDAYIIDSLGWALFKLKRYKEAEKYLQLAVKKMPGDPTVNDHYGDVLWMNSKNMQARYYWKYVLNLKKTEQKLKETIKLKMLSGPKSIL
tara:strand:+ start:471 stop:2186 length:1716 start_codon:yes stop_codon:yes gene_type:complete